MMHDTLVPSRMSESTPACGTFDAASVFQAAQASDALACEVIRTTAKYLGRGLSLLINILNPQKILIGGGVAKSGLQVLELIRQYTAQYTLHRAAKETEIVFSHEIDALPVVGAANLIFRRQKPRAVVASACASSFVEQEL